MAKDLESTPEGAVQPPDLKTAEGVKSFMSGSASEDDWNLRCDQVQAANQNQYPDFWFSTVVMTGLAREIFAKWEGTDQTKVSAIKTAPEPNGK